VLNFFAHSDRPDQGTARDGMAVNINDINGLLCDFGVIRITFSAAAI